MAFTTSFLFLSKTRNCQCLMFVISFKIVFWFCCCFNSGTISWIQTWSQGFPGGVDVSEVKEVYLDLLKKGVQFPTSEAEAETARQEVGCLPWANRELVCYEILLSLKRTTLPPSTLHPKSWIYEKTIAISPRIIKKVGVSWIFGTTESQPLKCPMTCLSLRAIFSHIVDNISLKFSC